MRRVMRQARTSNSQNCRFPSISKKFRKFVFQKVFLVVRTFTWDIRSCKAMNPTSLNRFLSQQTANLERQRLKTFLRKTYSHLLKSIAKKASHKVLIDSGFSHSPKKVFHQIFFQGVDLWTIKSRFTIFQNLTHQLPPKVQDLNQKKMKTKKMISHLRGVVYLSTFALSMILWKWVKSSSTRQRLALESNTTCQFLFAPNRTFLMANRNSMNLFKPYSTLSLS